MNTRVPTHRSRRKIRWIWSAAWMSLLLLGGWLWIHLATPTAPGAVFGLYAFQSPDGWVATWELKPDFTCTQRYYETMEDFTAGAAPAKVNDTCRWTFSHAHPRWELPKVTFDGAWSDQRNPLRNTLPLSAVYGGVASLDKGADGAPRLVFDDEVGDWVCRIRRVAGGRYEGLERLREGSDAMARSFDSGLVSLERKP